MTLIGRTVWFIYAASIHSGVVIDQCLSPAAVKVKPHAAHLPVTTLMVYYFRPQEAIAEARNIAYMMNSEADKLERKLQAESEA